MTDNKKRNPFLTIIFILFLIYISIYILSVSGYYESKMHLKTTYTQEKIQEFEQDVKEGKEIDIYKYIEDDNKDYSNIFTKTSDEIGTFITKIMGNGIEESFKIIKVLFG